MSQSEKNYCLEMTNENARMRRILGRLSIAYASRKLLGNIKPIQSGKFGKPMVNGLSFSISHSESLSKKQFCVCSAYANNNYDVGIDVSLRDKPMINVKTSPNEFLDRLRINQGLGSPGEWSQIDSAENVNSKLNTFYRLWSIKESVLKATGLGASGIKPSLIDIILNGAHPYDCLLSYRDDAKFLIRDELMTATVFEEKLKIDKSEFYLSETIMKSGFTFPAFQPIEELDLDNLIHELS